MSCMAIYGIKRFDFRVVCPLRALLSKKFTYVTDFSLRLTQVLQFYSATFVHLCVSYLHPIGSVPILAYTILL